MVSRAAQLSQGRGPELRPEVCRMRAPDTTEKPVGKGEEPNDREAVVLINGLGSDRYVRVTGTTTLLQAYQYSKWGRAGQSALLEEFHTVEAQSEHRTELEPCDLG